MRRVPRRVTAEDFRAIDGILDECWDGGRKLPAWALASMKSIVTRGVPPKGTGQR